MEIQLQRFQRVRDGILGLASWGPHMWWTMEREWHHNMAGRSCVPLGRYELKRFNGTKYPDTFALVGKTVSVYPSPEYPRSACVLHAANKGVELEGCVAFGLGAYLGAGTITDSRAGTDQVIGLLRNAPGKHWLNITDSREVAT